MVALCQNLAPIIAAPVTAATAVGAAPVTAIAANNKSSSGKFSSIDSARVYELAIPQHREGLMSSLSLAIAMLPEKEEWSADPWPLEEPMLLLWLAGTLG